MTQKEAIGQLSSYLFHNEHMMGTEYYEALKLAISALQAGDGKMSEDEVKVEILSSLIGRYAYRYADLNDEQKVDIDKELDKLSKKLSHPLSPEKCKIPNCECGGDAIIKCIHQRPIDQCPHCNGASPSPCGEEKKGRIEVRKCPKCGTEMIGESLVVKLTALEVGKEER